MKMNALNFSALLNLTFKLLIVFTFLSFASNRVNAAEWQSIDSIEKAAQRFMQKSAGKNGLDMEFNVEKLDSRLHLAQCQRALSVRPRSKIKPGAMSLQIECHGNKAWKIYLPVRVKIWRTVLAAARPLPRGHRITAEDVISVREAQNSSNQARYMQDQLPDLLGKIVNRSQASGRPFDARFLKAPLWVKRGQTVTLLAETSSIQIRMKGNALADGAKGDLIKVRNLSSRRIVEGVVVKPGVISVTM